MQTRLKMSREGLDLLKEFEGLRLTAVRLSDGRWSMGHGHTQYAREGATITAGDAEALLIYDLIPVVAAVNDSVVPEISQNQFDALVCFAFNVGIEAFSQSEVLQRVNQERMTEAALAMAIWRAGAFNGRRVVLDALVRRRSAEEALMLGRDGRTAPSDLVRPEIDPQAQGALPSEPPARIEETFDGEQAGVRLVEGAPVEVTIVTDEDAVAPEATVEEMPLAEPLAPSGPDTGEAAVEAAVEPIEQAEAGAGPSTGGNTDTEATPTGETPVAADGPSAFGAGLRVSDDDAAEPPVPANLAEDTPPARAYSSVPIAPFSPLNAAGPQGEPTAAIVPQPEDETTGLMDAPPIGAQIDEPPLVLILTPPPEVAGEPRQPALEPAPTIEAAEAPADQAPLFDPAGQATGVNEGDPVIYYEPEDEVVDRTSRWSETGAYVTTSLVGLAAFGFGIAGFQMAGQDAIAPGTFDEKTAISWVLVAIGVVCVWIGAYNLFKRLGGPEEG